MARGNAYCHAFMRMQNISTESPPDNTELFKQIDAI
jgi:hypothetical protein